MSEGGHGTSSTALVAATDTWTPHAVATHHELITKIKKVKNKMILYLFSWQATEYVNSLWDFTLVRLNNGTHVVYGASN